ncbi:hypothetical protein [Halalkalibacter krulwichiae]|uniref:Uncharacterized protein n=1 Tax=Halalkalibacter krulwichiae TaxID=199441 RepID=A0A1X9ME44_9BACI|nr:hypothetical protein [Halalkalibacter krulwichiae]ARK31715.1 hypothetical protein BkAM31D_18765 [Halalkalibacter krulwichiae]
MNRWYSLSVVAFLLFGVFAGPVSAAGTELMSLFSIRITVVEKGIEYQWEFDSPSQYEFEHGNHVVKGKEAKKKMEQVLDILKLDEQEDVTNYVKRLKESQYPNLERIDIRFMNGEGKLFTWVWQDHK